MPGRCGRRLKSVAARLTYPGSMNTRNLPFLVGTAIAYGVPEEDALAMITRVPAELLGLGDERGTLTTGKRATLFVSRGDALDGLFLLGMWMVHVPAFLISVTRRRSITHPHY